MGVVNAGAALHLYYPAAHTDGMNPDDAYLAGLDFFDHTISRFPADAWQNTSPCAGWNAIDVLGHMGSAVGFGTELLDGIIRHPVDRAIAGHPRNAHARGMFFHPHAREIRNQRELQRDWQRIAKRSTEREPHLRCYFVEPGGRTAPKRVIYLSDVTGPLNVEQFAQFGEWALHILDGRVDVWRIAVLISRPGPSDVTDHDIAWAASIYESAQRVGLGCTVMHLAAGRVVMPIPLDDILGRIVAA